MSSEHSHSADHGPAKGAHPTEGFYTLVAVILFAVTITEVAILYPPLDQLPEFLKVGILIILSISKFVAVVAFFMHLYYDSPICTFFFGLGMVLASGTMVALIHILPGPPLHQLQPTGKHRKGVDDPPPVPKAYAPVPGEVAARLANAHGLG